MGDWYGNFRMQLLQRCGNASLAIQPINPKAASNRSRMPPFPMNMAENQSLPQFCSRVLQSGFCSC